MQSQIQPPPNSWQRASFVFHRWRRMIPVGQCPRSMRFVLATFVALLLPFAVACVQGQEWDCQTPECEGHKAGYNWALNHDVTGLDCDTAAQKTNSPSFGDGCKVGVQVRERIAAQRFAEAREQIIPLVQEYMLGKQLAKELRVLPSECEEAYKSVAESKGDLLAAPFRTGCLEVAKKQANKVLKERAKRAKEATKQAKRQTLEENRSASKPGATAGGDAPVDTQAIADAIAGAKAGDVVAQYNLGYDYYLGQGVTQDYSLAAVWWRKVAEQGNSSAQGNLGLLYFEGQGVEQDDTQAAAWYRKAAEQGNPEAQSNLAILYVSGKGVSQDFQQAAQWSLKSANQNNAVGQCTLGSLYYFGQGVPQSYAEAYFWLDLSVARLNGPDNEKCEKNRNESASQLSPAELSKVQERAAGWFTEHRVLP